MHARLAEQPEPQNVTSSCAGPGTGCACGLRGTTAVPFCWKVCGGGGRGPTHLPIPLHWRCGRGRLRWDVASDHAVEGFGGAGGDETGEVRVAECGPGARPRPGVAAAFT